MIRLRLAAACTVIAALAGTPTAAAAPGDLDQTFGTGGIALTPFGSDDQVRAIALQPDGKTVAAGSTWDGSSYRFALARYAPDGSLDPTFGSAGKVVTAVGTASVAHAVALQVDGKIVVAGHAYGNGSPDFAVARYNADGSPDSSFSADGVTTTPIGNDATAYDVVVEPDGSVVAAGQARVSGSERFALARYTSAGALDTSFGSRGKASTPLGTGAAALDLLRQADGRLVAVGGASTNAGNRFALARYNADGSLDGSFGSAGSVLTAIAGGGTANAVTADADGRLIVAGGALDGTAYKTAVARYSADGAHDGSFGSGGAALAQVTGAALTYGVARQADGRIVVAGEAYSGATSHLFLTRFEADGALDGSFGAGGSVTTAIGSRSGAYDVAVQPDGQILAGGTGNGGSGARQFALARYAAVAPAGGGDGGTTDPGTGGGTDPGTGGTTDPGTGGSGGTTDPGTGGTTDPGTGGTTDPGTGGTTDPGTGGTTPGTGGSQEPGGGLAGQIVPDGLALLPPDVKPIVLPQQPLKLQNTGVVPVRVRCIELTAIDCKGTIVITASEQVMLPFIRQHRKADLGSARRRKRVRIARASVTVRSGRSGTARPKLTGPALRAVRRLGSIRVTVEASMVVGGEVRTSRRTLTLKAPRRGR